MSTLSDTTNVCCHVKHSLQILTKLAFSFENDLRLQEHLKCQLHLYSDCDMKISYVKKTYFAYYTCVKHSRSGHYFGVIGTTRNLKSQIIALTDDEADIMVVT